MRILVTGAEGFIGKKLCAALQVLDVRALAVIREWETWLRDTLAEKLSEQATRYEPVKQALLNS